MDSSKISSFAILPACLGICVSPDHIRRSASNESFVLVLWCYRYIVTKIAKKLSRNTKNIPKLAPFRKIPTRSNNADNILQN